MRVLMVASEYPPAKVYGLGRAVHDLSRALAARGDEVHVLTNSIGRREQDVVMDGVSVHRINYPSPPEPPDPTSCVVQFNLCLVERAHQLLPVLPAIDLVHAHDWLVGLAAHSIARRLQTPLVTTLHDMAVGKHFGQLDRAQQYIAFTERWLTEQSERIIACSEFIKGELALHCGAEPEKVEVIPCGVDPGPLQLPVNLPAFRSVFSRPEERLLLYVGRLDREKGVEVLVHGFARLHPREAQLRLVIVGEGQVRQQLQELVSSLALTDAVTFLGYVAPPALGAVYQSAEMAVVPSLYEPFGMVALEAMAAGRPVIASDAGGLREIVADGQTGLRVPAGDAEAIAVAVSRLLGDQQLAARLAARGRERALGEFSWDRVAGLTHSCYASMLSDRAEGSR